MAVADVMAFRVVKVSPDTLDEVASKGQLRLSSYFYNLLFTMNHTMTHHNSSCIRGTDVNEDKQRTSMVTHNSD